MTDRTLDRRFAEVRLLSLDVDGVLTDGGIYFNDSGEEMRRFNVKDGMGIKLLQKAGVELCIISASITPSIRHRAARLGIEHCFVGAKEKLAILDDLCAKLAIGMAQVAHMGDDVNDIPILERVGLALTVPDCAPGVRALAHYVTSRDGGDGAVREVCDRILAAKGLG